MDFKYFSKNGKLLSIEEAVVPLSNIEYQYGFGVYESIRVANGAPYFLADHIERLMESARTIGLTHSFDETFVEKAIADLMQKTEAESYNLKILLLGGAAPILSIIPLNPHFPDKKLYRDGIHLISFKYERAFPHAKSLNMLQSYLAYAEAKKAGAYDALLIDNKGNITEGTRTNFFAMKGKTLFSAPEAEVLLGVTRKYVTQTAKAVGLDVVEQHMPLASIAEYEAAFITSTSSKIVPVQSIDSHAFGARPKALDDLMAAFDAFLATFRS